MKDFKIISHYSGMREDLVQAGGGNTSVKIDERIMRVKASGFQLTEVTDIQGFAEVDYALIRNSFSGLSTDADYNNLLKESTISGGKPSIETVLHAISPWKYTLHTHPTVVNILAVNTQGINELKALFPESIIIDYAPPGLALAKMLDVKKIISDQPVFLKNHGLITGGSTANDVINRNEMIIKTIADHLRIDCSAFSESTALWKSNGQNNIVYYCRNAILENAANKESFDFNFCPDCIVYCKDSVLLHKGHYYTIASSIKKAKEIESVLSFAAEVVSHNINTAIDYLPSEEQSSLLGREDEKYRQSLK